MTIRDEYSDSEPFSVEIDSKVGGKGKQERMKRPCDIFESAKKHAARRRKKNNQLKRKLRRLGNR